MKRGDLVELTPHHSKPAPLGIVIRLTKREYDWPYPGQWWWVMWSDGDRTVESEKDIVVLV